VRPSLWRPASGLEGWTQALCQGDCVAGRRRSWGLPRSEARVSRGASSGRQWSDTRVGTVDMDVGLGDPLHRRAFGCGKSTLLESSRSAQPDRRERSPFQQEVKDRRKPTAMVSKITAFPWKSVLANVRFGLDLAGVPRSDANARRHLAGAPGLADYADAYPSVLSVACEQRVSDRPRFRGWPESPVNGRTIRALDAQLRTILQEELWSCGKRPQNGGLCYPQLEEPLLLGDRVLVMSSRPGASWRSSASSLPGGAPSNCGRPGASANWTTYLAPFCVRKWNSRCVVALLCRRSGQVSNH